MKIGSIENMEKIASIRGGKCLSKQYLGWHVHLSWECEFKHQWNATPYNIKQGTWCPFCAGVVKPTLEQIQNLAKAKGGICISTKYKNAHDKLIWKCNKSHIWYARLHDIKQGTWCPQCASIERGIKHRKYKLEDAQKFARSLGGNCLSVEYSTTKEKLKWECKYGHKWSMTFTDVLSDHWCPFCSRNISEVFCRLCFESLFGVAFNKQRPKWLINDDNNRMELDGYNEELKIAFEYQGEQHFTEKHLFHSSVESYNKRNRDDKKKVILCEQNKVKLISVPYYVSIKELPEYIYNECLARKLKPIFKVTLDEISKILLFVNRQYEAVERNIIEKNGKLLSKVYPGANGKLKIVCENGHVWSARFSNIQRGHWCPYCAGSVRSTIDEMNKIAQSRKGQCLSREYFNAHTKLKWQCEKGHIWSAKPHDIKESKTWCPYCAGKYKKIEYFKKYAESKGGVCLSDKYEGVTKYLKWKCKEGHIWNATPRIADKGTWCSICSRVLGGIKRRKNNVA